MRSPSSSGSSTVKRLYLIRGLPGSGKSTLARSLVATSPDGRVCEADDYFITANGDYTFNADLLKDAHAYCQKRAEHAMDFDLPVIAVSNTFTREWEYAPYLKLAKSHGYSVTIIECHADHGSSHAVPKGTLTSMRARWQPTA